MQELIRKIETREIMIVERPSIEVTMGGAIAYSDNDTMESFLDKLVASLKEVEKQGGMIPGDIQIITDGKKIAATMKMGR